MISLHSLLKIALAVTFAATNIASASEAAPSLRTTVNLNREWKFQVGDHPGAEAVACNDAEWDTIGLPHSFSLPYFLSDKFYVGYGWYRKHFEIPAAWARKRVFLEFEGAFQDAEVFVNGKPVGRHLGGYTGFSFDITDAVKRGDNVVAVRLNNNWNPELPPRAGEHVFSGGIYRDVHLVVTDPLHVAWYGTFVTTPQVSKEAATMKVKTEVRNDARSAKQCTVRTDILDSDGNQVESLSSTQLVAAGSTVVFDQTGEPLTNPKLWHPDHPFLYHAVTTVFDGKKPVDLYETTFGIRWFKWTADQGFFLNGEHYYFKGANAHQDHAGWGDAVANSGFERDVKLVKDAGFDFIRGSHYPHAPAFAAACDKLGVLFWSEACYWGTAGFKSPWGSSAYPPEEKYQAAFDENAKQALREMIRIHRNHPSIVVWSMCNEAFFTAPPTYSKAPRLLKTMVALSHELDPSRPAAIGGCQRGDHDKLGDIAGYNGDGARLFINPGIANVVTEYGSTVADRPGEYDPGWGDLQREQFPWRSGQALWCAFDHGSIAGHFGCMGMVDYFRLPKRQWYWYRNEYRKIPPPEWPSNGVPAGLKLTADKMTLKNVDGTDDAQLVVTVVDADGKPISNCPMVTLTIESGPGEFPTGPSITFAPDSDIAIRDGQAAIEFRSYYAGKSMIRATSPGLKDATLTIASTGGPSFIPDKTPPVHPRPYARFTGQSTVASDIMTYGRENPTRASNEADGHTARFGNDGNSATFWEAKDTQPGAWWQVDLERLVTISEVTLMFPAEGNYRYVVEASTDASTWKPVVDFSHSTDTARTRRHSVPPGVSGRFLRVNFTDLPAGQPAALSEIEVRGTPQTQ